jgi:four helix bundle protein
MEKNNHVNSFKELEVYRQSRELSNKIFELTKLFPKEEKYSLTDQMRRSSRSIGANIAESWGKRRYESHFILKLTDSDAEQFETQHWIEIAHENNYISDVIKQELLVNCEAIGKMLNSMIVKSSKFCQPRN